MKPELVNAIIKLGVPAAIAVFLVWFLTFSVSEDLNEQKTLMQQQGVAEAIHSEMQTRHIEATTRDALELRVLLRQICINTAKTDAQRAGCLTN